MAEAAKPARILETRKTAPGLRLVDKWAVSTRAPLYHSVSGTLMPFRLLCPLWKGRSFLVVMEAWKPIRGMELDMEAWKAWKAIRDMSAAMIPTHSCLFATVKVVIGNAFKIFQCNQVHGLMCASNVELWNVLYLVFAL